MPQQKYEAPRVMSSASLVSVFIISSGIQRDSSAQTVEISMEKRRAIPPPH